MDFNTSEWFSRWYADNNITDPEAQLQEYNRIKREGVTTFGADGITSVKDHFAKWYEGEFSSIKGMNVAPGKKEEEEKETGKWARKSYDIDGSNKNWIPRSTIATWANKINNREDLDFGSDGKYYWDDSKNSYYFQEEGGTPQRINSKKVMFLTLSGAKSMTRQFQSDPGYQGVSDWFDKDFKNPQFDWSTLPKDEDKALEQLQSYYGKYGLEFDTAYLGEDMIKFGDEKYDLNNPSDMEELKEVVEYAEFKFKLDARNEDPFNPNN